MCEEISISGDHYQHALRDITNSSNSITKDARSERRLKLSRKRKIMGHGIAEDTQSEIVSVQSGGFTHIGSAITLEFEPNNQTGHTVEPLYYYYHYLSY